MTRSEVATAGKRLAARMVLRMEFLQACTRDMGIDLRGRQITVTKQDLNHTQVGTVVQQVRRKRMPQCVW